MLLLASSILSFLIAKSNALSVEDYLLLIVIMKSIIYAGMVFIAGVLSRRNKKLTA